MAMTIQINVRIEEKSVEKLQALVYAGEFDNVPAAIRWCVRMQLKEIKNRTPPPRRFGGVKNGHH